MHANVGKGGREKRGTEDTIFDYLPAHPALMKPNENVSTYAITCEVSLPLTTNTPTKSLNGGEDVIGLVDTPPPYPPPSLLLLTHIYKGDKDKVKIRMR